MNKRPSIVILFFTLVVVMLGFGMVIPLLPFYIESFGASGSGLGLLMAIFSVAQFIFSPIWGSLSDRVGRKKVLLIGVFGNAVSMLFFGLSTSLWMLYASRALAGILSSATLPVAMAYISDSTSEKNRGGGMGIIGAAMGVGMVLGPGVGGWLASEQNLALPFFVAAGLSLAAMLLILALLPESLPVENRQAAQRTTDPQFKSLLKTLAGPLGFLMALSFMVFFALANFEAIFGLYAQHRFDYGPQQVGTILTVIGLVSALVQGLVTGPATRWLGEGIIIRASLIFSAVGFFLMLLAWNMASVLLTVGFFVFANSMLRPAIASSISRKAGGDQGAVMGISNSFMSLGRIAGPLWAGLFFDLNLALPYLSGGVVLVLVFVASLVWWKDAPGRPQPVKTDPIPAAMD